MWWAFVVYMISSWSILKVTFQYSYLQFYFLVQYVNTEFAKKYVQRKISVKLQASSGKRWPCQFCYRDGSATPKTISRGWKSFVRDNGIKAGDACVFVLINRMDVVLKVSIFRVAEYAWQVNQPLNLDNLPKLVVGDFDVKLNMVPIFFLGFLLLVGLCTLMPRPFGKFVHWLDLVEKVCNTKLMLFMLKLFCNFLHLKPWKAGNNAYNLWGISLSDKANRILIWLFHQNIPILRKCNAAVAQSCKKTRWWNYCPRFTVKVKLLFVFGNLMYNKK